MLLSSSRIFLIGTVLLNALIRHLSNVGKRCYKIYQDGIRYLLVMITHYIIIIYVKKSCNMPKLIFVGGNGLCCHKLPLNCGHTRTTFQTPQKVIFSIISKSRRTILK